MNKELAIEKLKEAIKEGDTLWTQLHHVTKSGMTRYIGVRFLKDDYPYTYTYYVAKALDWKMSDKYEGVKVVGCGMDMGFHLIYSLSHALYGDGYAIKQRWL
tara:strand:- start:619 stop:924 length:306 start_codon:yes stop_codon:yes gene_type:complete